MSAVLSTLLPLLAAAIAAGIIGRTIGAEAAGSAIILGFAVAYLAILGWPVLPPQSSLHKIILVSVAGLFLGTALLLSASRAWIRPMTIIWPGIIVAWLGSRQLIGLEASDLLTLAALWLAGAFIFDRLAAPPAAEIDAPTMVLIAGIGTSLIAFLGSAASLSQLAAALAAATGGFLLWNWPKKRYPFSIPTLFGTASTLLAIGAATVLFTRASTLALLILLVTFAAGIIRSRILFIERPVAGPIAFGAACAIPMLVAVAVAFLTATGPVD
jgi:hypothetical protein